MPVSRAIGGRVELVIAVKVVHSDGLLDDGQEVVVVLQVEVGLLVFLHHQVAHPHVVLQLLLAIDPVLEQRLQLGIQLFLLSLASLATDQRRHVTF